MKFYQPQLPYDIELKVPSLEQYCRLTFDPNLYFNPEAMPIYMKQPAAMPGEVTYRERVQTETSPLQRLAPGYENVMRFLYFSKLLLHARWMKRLIINRKETNNRC